MTINLNDYKVILNSIKAILENNPNNSYSKLASECAVATQAPVIVCCYYIAHLVGINPEIQNLIDRLVVFYKYDKIYGVEDWIK